MFMVGRVRGTGVGGSFIIFNCESGVAILKSLTTTLLYYLIDISQFSTIKDLQDNMRWMGILKSDFKTVFRSH